MDVKIFLWGIWGGMDGFEIFHSLTWSLLLSGVSRLEADWE